MDIVIGYSDEDDEDDNDDDDDNIAVTLRRHKSLPRGLLNDKERTRGDVHPWRHLTIDPDLDDGSTRTVIQCVIKVIEHH